MALSLGFGGFASPVNQRAGLSARARVRRGLGSVALSLGFGGLASPPNRLVGLPVRASQDEARLVALLARPARGSPRDWRINSVAPSTRASRR